jgi:hypothetical protein
MVGGTDRPIPPVLTTLQIKSAKPAERAYKLADTGGLFVLVQPNGSKLWRYKCRRRTKFEPPCRPNIEPGVEADFERVGCG